MKRRIIFVEYASFPCYKILRINGRSFTNMDKAIDAVRAAGMKNIQLRQVGDGFKIEWDNF